MHVFVTGASGFVGSEVTRQLIGAGHAVTGLARSQASAAALESAGASVLRGELTDVDRLAHGAKAADAVVHTAFIHDFSNFAASVEVDRRAIEAIGAALAGSGKSFLVTSGIGLLPQGQLVTEQDSAATTGHAALRGASEALALALVGRDVRVGIIRLPPSVHGDGDRGFVPALVDLARKSGVSAYVGQGQNHWPAVHRSDAARLYVLALENGAAGACYHAVGEQGIAFRDLAATIGRKLGLPCVSVSREDAAGSLGWMANFAQMDVPASSGWTRRELGWLPTGPGLLEDLEQGTYFTA